MNASEIDLIAFTDAVTEVLASNRGDATNGMALYALWRGVAAIVDPALASDTFKNGLDIVQTTGFIEVTVGNDQHPDSVFDRVEHVALLPAGQRFHENLQKLKAA